MIQVPNAAGSHMSAYMAIPKAGKGAGVVVLQEIFGVTPAMKKICDFLADRQYTAICPDLYWSAEANAQLDESNDVEKARALRMKMDDATVVSDIGAAVAFLRKHPACIGSVGVVGYCWGGMLAFLSATQADGEGKPDAAVSYYGVGLDKHIAKAATLTCPMMLHFAGQDTYVPAETVSQVKSALSGKDAKIWEYPDAGHAFARPGGAHYHHRSADVADMRTLGFFVETLIGKRRK
jgi:carboxymethylenebutenolidase